MSIKRNVSDDKSINISAPGGQTFNMINVTMIGVVMRAYGIKTVVNAPDWLTGERYDIIAKAAGQPSADRADAMLRTMLKQRLKLAAHIEPRETIGVCAGGRTAQPSRAEAVHARLRCDPRRARGRRLRQGYGGQAPAPPSPTSGPACGYTWSSAIYSGGIPLAQLAGMLDWVAGRTIIDRTGLPGRYEFTLRFASPTAPPSDAADAPPILFTALQEQLGLRLDAVRAPVDTLVIDHIERPAEN